MTGIRRGITEIALKEWRAGQINSERLCAGLLSIEGFKSINPQATLGGSDGLKDLIFKNRDKKYIAAVYFPPTNKNFSEIWKKFLHDIDGVKKNGAFGIAFFVNHRLTVKDQEILEKLSLEKECDLELYHLERMRVLLDSPVGYGLRQQFLNIEMTSEELVSAQDLWQRNLKETIKIQPSAQFLVERIFHTHAMLTQLISDQDKKHFPKRMQEVLSLTGNRDIPITSYFTINLILFIHKIICDNGDHTISPGKLRTVQTWIGAYGVPISEAIYVPPHYSKVPHMLFNLLEEWNKNFISIYNNTDDDKIRAIAMFHSSFLSIHPFVDANGRISRLIMDQQLQDLLDLNIHIEFSERKVEYFNALQLAQRGENDKLYILLKEEIKSKLIKN